MIAVYFQPTTIDILNLGTWVGLVLSVAFVLGLAFVFVNWIEDSMEAIHNEDHPLPPKENVVPFHHARKVHR